MTETTSDSERATKLIASIGGPVLDPRDIEWVNDLEAGKLLLNWLSSQITNDITAEGRHGEGGDANRDTVDPYLDLDLDLEASITAAMKDTTLEPEEVLIANDERIRGLVASPDQSQDSMPEYMPDYMAPSQLQKHSQFLTSESSNVQQNADLYRSRISQTKEAANKIHGSIKSLQRAVYDLNTKLRGSEETLSELSITADTTIEATVNDCQELLHDLGMSGQPEHAEALESKISANDAFADLEGARSVLSICKTNIATLIAHFEERTVTLSQLREQDEEKSADIQMETERLQTMFNALQSKTQRSPQTNSGSSIALLDEAAAAELQVICDTLEQEISLRATGSVLGNGALDRLLSELHEGYITDKQGEGKGKLEFVYEHLRQAWSMDQAAILQLHGEVLDEALSALSAALAPPEVVYTSLARLAKCVQEAEAVLEAFAEELGEIYLDGSQSEDKGSPSQDELEDIETEQQVKEVLNECKDLRPAGSPPLVLLTREDILAELRSLKTRSAGVEGSERIWADSVIRNHSIRPLDPLLLQIYAHAATNSSPPFAFPANVRALEARARDKAASLNGLAQAVDEEVRQIFAKQSSTKKLDAFTEKWA